MHQSVDVREQRLEAIFESGLLAAGYEKRLKDTYDVPHAWDEGMLREFLQTTQPKVVTKLNLNEPKAWKRFAERLHTELQRRGVVDVLRHGVNHESCSGIRLYYALPDANNAEAVAMHAKNRFGVMRQVAYSQPHVLNPGIVDMVLTINGLPVVTIELKNEFTGQTYRDAVAQYRKDRDPREPLFSLGRCAVHFAIDNHEVHMCARLEGKTSRFLPFNRGREDGSAGNPPNPNGVAVSYMWKDMLTPASLCDIIEHYACRVSYRKADKVTQKSRMVTEVIFPRYHQLDAARRLLRDVREKGVGHQYLIQHSAGSGKSNTISWLVLQLTGVMNPKEQNRYLFDCVVVVTDRRNLDRQLHANINRVSDMKERIFHADGSKKLKSALENDGKRIIISTVQKFPNVLRQIGKMKEKTFAIVIDEAHSSQGGKNAGALNKVLGLAGLQGRKSEADDDLVDVLADCADADAALEQSAKLRKLIANADYFAFTATPKVKTLRMFGHVLRDGDGKPMLTDDGEYRYGAFHTYSMKQAIQEGFIMDVLAHYTPVKSYYRLMAKEGADETQEYDSSRALAKLRAAVEGHRVPIAVKAAIIVDHFRRHVAKAMRGEARAMVVCSSIQRAIDYFHAIKKELERVKSPYLPVVAFSGEKEIDGRQVSEATLNGFSSAEIEDRIASGNYRILVVADKFQTGYDEPLMQTMYVDKKLSGVKTVQTLSRLNRAHPDKRSTFVLDFYNEAAAVKKDFERYYTTTVLSGESDPDTLHDLQAQLDGAGVYTEAQLREVVDIFLSRPAEEFRMRALLDVCTEVYKTELNAEAQIAFKGAAKSFCRTYDFLASVLPYFMTEWERLSCFLQLLLRQLPSPDPTEDDHVVDAVQLESYRAEVQDTLRMSLAEDGGEMLPPNPGMNGGVPAPAMEPLEQIISLFNDALGDIAWHDRDKVSEILKKLAKHLAQDVSVQAAVENSDDENAGLKVGDAIRKLLVKSLTSAAHDTKDLHELLQAYEDNRNSFREELIAAQLGLLRLLFTAPSAEAEKTLPARDLLAAEEGAR